MTAPAPMRASGATQRACALLSDWTKKVSVFVDISAMSHEMIANVVLAIGQAQELGEISVSVSYAPSKFTSQYQAAPIRITAPIKSTLAGWSSKPGKPLGAVFGLGCEPDLALGALQVLEPSKAWVFSPNGVVMTSRSLNMASLRQRIPGHVLKRL